MKKLFAWTLAAVIVLSFASLPATAQTSKEAQDVLNKMINALGGRKNLDTIKDTTESGTIELTSMGMSGTVTIYQKEPNKLRMDMEIMGMVVTQAYTGEKGWWTNPQTGATEDMTEAQNKDFARQAMGNGAFLNPQKFGIVYALKPKAKLENKEYIVLEQTMADGHKSTIYVDPATYLTYKLETTTMGQAGAEVKSESYPNDYRKVGETQVAFASRIVQDGADFAKITVTKVTFNTNLEDSLFLSGK